ncbi:thiol-disulfide oxidoreductase DCC family protein [Ulvibacter antarcticus]|uniref:Putative DCC family thiol-disulfide oxidoreductase YuxK n=1 Tax=Ulvibacter antarcticus TaxID=442714 RepID=A0A3L9YUC3_9FLAO|nr:thiol-disulfide oxidoreductase DCC family protein [Ulvibacter antarcticus]RMA64256.1 putative DCC family thiol-disulfide oxidoreductase YuxK [Ulvibacter antarcticus]
MKKETKHKIILFDGVCNLCNSTIVRIIKNDNKDIFRFTPLQSAVGMVMITEHGIDTSDTDSVILIDNGKAYIKSTAALRIARKLSGGYSLLYGFMIFPKFIRDAVYNFIAKNRYKWFGKKESCMIPTPELKKKFL